MTDASEEDVFTTELDEEPDVDVDHVVEGASAGGAAGAVLEFIARSIVDEPNAVRVETDHDRRGVILRLHVAPDDMGKVIGRRGRVAQAIRMLVRATAAREGVEANVDIVD